MRKLISVVIMVSMLLNYTSYVFAYMVNPFYAIDSAVEYEKIKGTISGDNNNIYFQWGRLARNNEGKIQFSNKMSFGISQYDNRPEYGIPYKLGEVPQAEYTVQSGDSLSVIAGRYGIPYKMLGEYNQITDISKIQVGQKLSIPSIGYDTSSQEDYKQRYPNGKALLSVFFEAMEYADKKNSAVEFLNMDENSWVEYIIKPMMDTVTSIGFDGVVLDFEGFRDSFSGENYSNDQRTGLKAKYTKFLIFLKKYLGTKALTVIVHPTNVAGYFDGYDINGIANVSDNLILMAYDFQNFLKYGVNDGVPAELIGKIKDIGASPLSQPFIQPYSKVEDAVKNILKIGVNSSKILLGINLVGMRWIKYTKDINGKTYVYYELERPDLETVEAAPVEEQYMESPAVSRKILSSKDISDADKQALQKNGYEVVSIEYQYESPKSLYSKYYNIVKAYKLSGVTVWRIGKGSERVWKSLMDMFVPASTSTSTSTSTPTPSPTPTPQTQTDSSMTITMKIGNPYMNVNGIEKEIDPGRGTVPLIKNDRTMIPIRTVIESLGGQINWDGKKSLVTINYNGIEIALTINSKKIIVNGIGKDNDVAPMISNERTYLPLRFLLENLGYKVEWDESSKTVEIRI